MLNKASLSDLVEDLVVYRDLDTVDQRLPRFSAAWAEMGLPGPARPRKIDVDYAKALAWLLRKARALSAPSVELSELIVIGDTTLSDANAFLNIRKVTGWRGWAFIGAERDEEMAVAEKDGVYSANRWSALAEFIEWMLVNRAAALDQRTAVVIDIDKTALGARGRNDGVIDRARVAAIEATVAEALGPQFDQRVFRRAYADLNVAKYHPFTADNQDNLAYVCLMLSAGLESLERVLADLVAGQLKTSVDFMDRIQARRAELGNPALLKLHDEVYARVQAGDPTPFKAFRLREFRETIGRMGQLPDNAPLGQRLVDEICITREVRDAAEWLKRRGCLLIAVSDKPDEAALPPREGIGHDCPSLHRALTHIAGVSIAELLPA